MYLTRYLRPGYPKIIKAIAKLKAGLASIRLSHRVFSNLSRLVIHDVGVRESDQRQK